MKYHNIDFIINQKLNKKQLLKKHEADLIIGTIAGIGLFTFNGLEDNNESNVHASTLDKNSPNSSSGASTPSNSDSNASSATTSAADNSSSDTSSASSANSNSASSGASNQSTSSTSAGSASNPASSASSTSDDDLDYRTGDSEPIQHTVNIMGSDGSEHPYVVSGNDGDTVTLPNGQAVKISGNQLLDPTNNDQAFNNGDNFNNGSFNPDYKDFNVQYTVKFVDSEGKPVANSYNGNNPSGTATFNTTIHGYDGEPFKLYYNSQFGRQFVGYTAQPIGNQIDPTNGAYFTAILGHGLINGNDMITLKSGTSYVHIRYFTITGQGDKQFFDAGNEQLVEGQQPDLKTPFDNYNKDNTRLTDYFTLPNDLSDNTYKNSNGNDNSYTLDIQLVPKQINQSLPIILRSTNNNGNTATDIPATVDFSGTYGNQSNVTVYSYNIHFKEGQQSPIDSNSKSIFVSNGTTLWATLGAKLNPDGTATFGNLNYSWTKDEFSNRPNWANNSNQNSNGITPILYYQPLNSSDVVSMPDTTYDVKFWGPANEDGSGYDPTSTDPKANAVNYRTYHWNLTSNDYTPLNSIYDMNSWAYPGFKNSDPKDVNNDYVIQITKDASGNVVPKRLQVAQYDNGAIELSNAKLDNNNIRWGIAMHDSVSKIHDAKSTIQNGVAGYTIPKNEFNPNSSDTTPVFYPNGVRVLSEWQSGNLLNYHDGNYYYGDDSGYQNPVELKYAPDNQQPQANTSDGHTSYDIGEINNFAQPYHITLNYLNTNDTNGGQTINGSPNTLPDAATISSKTITAYTEDRIYYDPISKAYYLQRYGKDTDKGQTASNIDSTKPELLFSAPSGYTYNLDVQNDCAANNFKQDSSKRGNQRTASWIVGNDADIPNANTQMHPYGPDGTDNQVAVYLTPSGPQESPVQVNVLYINLTNGNQMYSQSINAVYNPNDPTTFNISKYLPTTKSNNGTLMLQNGHQFPGFNQYLYIASNQLSRSYGDNKFATDYIYLLPNDPNEPVTYPLNIHFIDENGKAIDSGNHDINNLSGRQANSINQVLTSTNQTLWNNDGWQYVGMRLNDLNATLQNHADQEQLFNDSSSNGNIVFSKYQNIYIVLNTHSSNSGATSSPSGNSSSASSNNSSTVSSASSSTTSNSSVPSGTSSNSSSTTSNGSSTTSSAASNSSSASSSTTSNGSVPSSTASNSSSTTSNGSVPSNTASNSSSTTSNGSSATSSASSNSSSASSSITSNGSIPSGTSSNSSSTTSSASGNPSNTPTNSNNSAHPHHVPNPNANRKFTYTKVTTENRAKLAQTGEKDRSTILGLVTLGLSTLFFGGYFRRNKKRK